MSIRNKVSVVNTIQYTAQLKRFIAEGNEDTLAGFFANGNLAWIVDGEKLALIDVIGGCPHPVHEFGESCKESFDITCVEELNVSCSSPTPLLLVGLSSLYQSQICVYNPATRKVLRALQIKDVQIRCMAVVDNGASCLNSLTDVLSNMDGIVAIGCADGSVLLVDLNRQQLIKAYHGNALYRSTESSPQKVKFVNLDWDEETITAEIYDASRNGMSAIITLIEGDKADTEFGVTALSFSKETACLYIGYSSGLWQIWNLSLSTFKLMFECAECTSPVSSFCHIEPCEDPRPTLYLTVNHDGTETSMPLFNMYSMSYSSKHHINDYGPYYQDFISCNLSSTMSPGEDCGNVVSGRLINSASYSKNIKRNILQNMGLPEMEGIQMKLFITVYSLTYSRSGTHTFLCVFDLDQWYKEQMPPTPDVDSSYVEIIELSSEPLLSSTLLVDSFSLYHSDEPLEIHLVPRALSFKIISLSDTSVILFDKVGQQQLWLSNTEIIGAKSLVSPSKLFHACVSAGFMPSFPVECNVEATSPTNDEMRSYILSVCLDNGRTNVILEAVELWENGAYAGSNCTLNFLFDWAWGSVSSAYKCFTNICKVLFSSSNDIDASLKRRMQHSRLVLDWLHFIFVNFYSKYNNPLYKDTLEQRLKALEIINLFVHQVSWFMNVGLLPESNSLQGSPRVGVPYDYAKLNHLAEQRRQYLNDASIKLKKKGSVLNVAGAGLYLADSLIQDHSEIGNQWDDEGGTIAYPPPSIQSLLRSLRHQYVPVSRKMAIVLYTLLDLVNLLNKEKHENLISKVDTFHLLPQVTDGQTNAIKGLWHLDHSLYEEGLQYLFHHTITTLDISENLHRGVLHLLYLEGKAGLALQYLRFKKPSLTLPDDLKLEMSILLARDLVNEAYHFQKNHTFLRETLLRQLLTECLGRGTIGRVVSLPLDHYELSFFDHYLGKNRNQQNDDLRILLLLSRSKYNDAKSLHERLKALNRIHDALQQSNRDLIVKGFTNSLSDTSREMYLQKLDPNLKTSLEFKNSKPRPLSVYIKALDDHGLPNFVLPTKQLSSLTVAASVTLRKFVDYNKNSTELLWDQGEKEQSRPIAGSEDAKSFSRKRAATWISGGNKRTKMDEDAIARDESIAAFVGTPLVKRRSKEIQSETPRDSRHATQVHSILKSGKTPGTPAKSESVLNDDESETPKKTLRWNIPGDASQKIQVRKSLLSTSTQFSATEPKPLPNLTETPDKEEAIATPDSIKSRLRNRGTSSKKEDSVVWSEIVEDAKAKVLFSVDLQSPAGKTTPTHKQALSAKKRASSMQKKLWEKQMSEKLVLQLPNFSGMDSNMGACPSAMDGIGKLDVAGPSGEGNKAPSQFKLMEMEIDSNEVSLCNLSQSPITQTNFSEDLWEKIKNKGSQKRNVEETSGDSKTPAANIVPTESETTEVEGLQSKEGASVTTLPESEEQLKSSSTEGIADDPVPEALASSALNLSTTTHTEAEGSSQPITLHEHDSQQKDTPLEIITEDARETAASPESPSDEHKSNSTKETSTVFAPQQLPEISTVVSLARGHYPQDEDEEESEDPEEAEIPPAIEFAQPEEGLVIDTTFSAADKESECASNDTGNNPEDEVHSPGVSNADAENEDNESGSSVICLDSESEGEPPNQSETLDYEEYGDESTTSGSRNRSFFHDKYSSKPAGEAEQDDAPSQESSSEDDDDDEDEEEERDSSDVDIYNMDEAENEDEMPGDLEDELFELGRGIQKRDNVESDSESGQDDDEEEEEEEGDGEENEVEEEETNDPSKFESGTNDAFDVPENIVKKRNDDGLVVISSDESNDGSISRQSTQSGEGTSLDQPNVEPVETHMTEDQAAVNALLTSDQIQDDENGLGAQPDSVSNPEPQTSMSPTETITNETEEPPKSEVIDILNLSQGQMFFGSPLPAKVFNESLEKALFQLGTTKTGDTQPDSEMKDVKCDSDESPKVTDPELDNSQDERLDLKVDPEDVSCEEIATDAHSEGNHLLSEEPKENQEEKPETCENSTILSEAITNTCEKEDSGCEGKADVTFRCSSEPKENIVDVELQLNRCEVGTEEIIDEATVIAPPTPFKTVSVADTDVTQSETIHAEPLELNENQECKSNTSQVPLDNVEMESVAAKEASIIPEPMCADEVGLKVPQSETNEPHESTSDELCDKSVACQLTYIETVAQAVDRKSFCCQANMDQTEIINVDSPAKTETIVSTRSIEIINESCADMSEVTVTNVEEEIVLEPPTPFKNVGLLQWKSTATPQDPVNSASGESTPVNPLEIAFVNSSDSSNTPSMTPMRKSVRLRDRIQTPGRCLVPQDDLVDSYGELDLAAVDADLNAPMPVDRIVDKPKSILKRVSASKMSADPVVNVKRSHRSSSEPKDINEVEITSKSQRAEPISSKSRRASSVEPNFDKPKSIRSSALMHEKPSHIKESDARPENIPESDSHVIPKNADLTSGNPLEVAFIEDSATPVRKSLRIKERTKTPGKSLAMVQHSADMPTDGINVDSKALVGRNTEESSLVQNEDSKKQEKSTKSKSSSSKVSHDDPVKIKRSRRSSTESKGSPERKHLEKKPSERNRRASSSEPEKEKLISDQDEHKRSKNKGESERVKTSNPQSKDSRRRRSTSLQPEELDSRSHKDKRVSADTLPRENIENIPSKSRRSRRSTSVPLEVNEPHDEPRQAKSRSSKGEQPTGTSPSRKGQRTSMKRSTSLSSVNSSSQSEFESLGKKKRLSEERLDVDSESVKSLDMPASTSYSRRSRKMRSVRDQPAGVMESIEELPENTSQTTDTTARYNEIVSAAIKKWGPKPLDISKWLALAPSEPTLATKRKSSVQSNVPFTSRASKKSSIADPSTSTQSPPRSMVPPEEDISPASSVVSNASSKVLRSGRTIEENTPTRKGTTSRLLGKRRRSSKMLDRSMASPAKVLRSGRSVGGSEDGMSIVSQSEEEDRDDASSVNTSISSAVSGPIEQEPAGAGVTIEEIMSTRRLTRHQRSVLERSMSSSRREDRSPNDSPLATPLDQD